MKLYRLFNRTICILRDADGYFLRSKKTQEEWEKRVDWLSFQSQRSVQNYRSASFAYGNTVCELNTTKQVLHETLEQLEKCQEQSEEYRKMHADELQKRLELADRVRKMEPVHAKWVHLGPNGYDGNELMGRYGCTNCHYIQRRPLGSYVPYCENCGARMDGGDPA